MARKHSFTALLICCLVVSAALSYDPFPRPDGKRTVAGLFRRLEELRKRNVGCPGIAGTTCDPEDTGACPCGVYGVNYECEYETKSINPLLKEWECVKQ